MGATIVVGGQFGSEGKGKVVALITMVSPAPWVVRCGGPNSGHTIDLAGRRTVLRQVPAGVGNPEALLLLSAGCVIDEDVLLTEIKELNLAPDRIIVDPRAALVLPEDLEAEKCLTQAIASTGSGTGAALIGRMSRAQGRPLAKDSLHLRNAATVRPVAPMVHDHISAGGDVIVEGTQGFGLSLLHGPGYPYVTSRDTTASAFASEVGLAPRDISEVIMVIRTFPIRVGGPSGHLPKEITWETVRELSRAPKAIPEFTSVTRKLRRVAHFDPHLVSLAARYNRPTSIAIMGLDRLDFSNTRATAASSLSPCSLRFIRQAEDLAKAPARWLGTGFETSEAITIDGMGQSHAGD